MVNNHKKTKHKHSHLEISTEKIHNTHQHTHTHNAYVWTTVRASTTTRMPFFANGHTSAGYDWCAAVPGNK